MLKKTGEKLILDHPTFGRLEFEHGAHWITNTTIPFESAEIDAAFWLEYRPTLQSLDLLVPILADLPKFDLDARRTMKGLFQDLGAEDAKRQFGLNALEDLDDTKRCRLVEVQCFTGRAGRVCSILCFYDRHKPRRLHVMFSWVDGQRRVTVFSRTGYHPIVQPESDRTATMEHDVLGHLEFDADGFASTQLQLHETPVATDVYFEGKPSAKRLDAPARLLADLPALDQRARAAISEQLARGNEDDAASLYKSHHAEELADATLLDDATFLARLQLVRVGVDIEKRGGTVECDYSLGAEATQYVLSVRFTLAGRLREIAFES